MLPSSLHANNAREQTLVEESKVFRGRRSVASFVGIFRAAFWKFRMHRPR